MIIDTDLSTIKIFPENELEEIYQNVKTILTTAKGSVPLYREFGVDNHILDIPMNVARAKITAAIVKAVNKFEPRVKVRKVTYTGSMSGKLIPSVEVSLVE